MSGQADLLPPCMALSPGQCQPERTWTEEEEERQMLPRQTERGNGRREPTGRERSMHTHKGRQTKGVQGQELQKGLSSVRAALGALCRMHPNSTLTQPYDKYSLCLALWLQFPPGSPQFLQKKCPSVPHTALAFLLLISHSPTPVQQRREFSLINQDCVSPMPRK